jgi:PhnB protein
MQIHAYLLISGGRCREAFERYQQILGGELEVMAFSDMPPGEDAPVGPDQGDLLMHAALTVGDAVLMGSDDPTGDGGPMTGVAVSLTFADADEADRVFAALADGGEVGMPMGETFWAPRFGMCADRFGVSWMVSADAADAPPA